MNARLLESGEMERLRAVAPETLALAEMSLPEDVRVLVVEDGERIVGCLAAVRITHLEGLWIAPEYRGKVSVGRKLLRLSRLLAGFWKAPYAIAGAKSALMHKVGAALGARVESDGYMLTTEV